MDKFDQLTQCFNENSASRLLHNYYYKEFPPGWTRIKGHSHSAVEITCCVNGTAYYLIEDYPKPVVLNKNELLLIRQDTYHTMYISESSKCSCVGVHLNMDLPMASELDTLYQNLFFNKSNNVKLFADDTIIDCMKRISLEMGKRYLEFERVVKAELIRLLVFIKRCMKSTSKQFPAKNDYVADALAYIQSSITDIISPTDIARHVHISPEYLMRLFQQSIGKTVMQVILELRMDRAEHLLTNTTMNISQIADNCGYSNLQHFSMAFKKFTNLSPSQFRKESQQHEFFDPHN